MKTAYLVVSNVWVREVEVTPVDGEFCIVCSPGSRDGFMIRKNRLFETREAAEAALPYEKPEIKKSRYDYEIEAAEYQAKRYARQHSKKEEEPKWYRK